MSAVAQRPDYLIYAVDDRPPLPQLVFLGLQQVALVSIYLIMLVLVVREAGATHRVAQSTLSFAMIALGLGAIFQAWWKGPVGSGYLAPPVLSAIYLPASLAAAKVGGLPLVFGMTMVAGAFEGFLSRLLYRLRWMFPPVISGIIITSVGFEIGLIGLKEILCVSGTLCATDFLVHLAVALLTAAIMIGLSVWGQGPLRLYCTLLGLIIGFAAAAAGGLIPAAARVELAQAPVLALPGTGQLAYKFHPALLAPFLVAGLAAGLRTIGVLTICQQINDAGWQKPDLDSIQGGVLADGLASLASGALGAMGMSTSPSAVGTSKVTGATSRYIALAIGAWLFVLACFPKLAAVFLAFPSSVVGGTLLFAGCLNIVGGMQIMAAGGFDTRKTFIIGVSLLLGLSHLVYPAYFASLPRWANLLTSSLLATATLAAILLNLIFRLGIKRTAVIPLAEAGELEQAEKLIRQAARDWPVPTLILDQAAGAVQQTLKELQALGLPQLPLSLKLSYDDIDLVVDIAYKGHLPASPPAKRPVSERQEGHLPFAAGIAGSWRCVCPDPVTCSIKGAYCRIRLAF